MTEENIYKICDKPEWTKAEADGVYHGSADDIRDGFIHFSLADQLKGTLEKHYAGKRDLVLIEYKASRLGPKLKWEPSRGGALFPHFYGILPIDAASRIWELAEDASGNALLPDEMA